MTTIATPRSLSDSEALDRAAAVIATPRVEEGDSFVLHAPLDVLARSALLSLAPPESREGIRDRIASVAQIYNDWGTAIEREPDSSESLTRDAGSVLVRALEAGDLDAIDDAITWLTGRLDTNELVATLASPVLPSLAAAAHGPILLHLLPRVAARSLPAAAMARTTLHELGRHPDWTLTWFSATDPNQRAATDPVGWDQATLGAELVRRLTKPRLTQRPENNFIYPTMSATEQSGLAAETLADLTPHLTAATARNHLLRVAAHSMLQDDPNHAPYGWSHCLTMPQAALGIAHAAHDPSVAIATAATYVLGFRATLGATALAPNHVPEPTDIAPVDLVSSEPEQAAAAAWHAPIDRHPVIWRTLAGHAGAHHDAHLAKYTLACLDAARSDPDHHDLYRAAATYLNAWWNQPHT